METIGFIGLGSMGLPMATNLQAAGFGLRVYNRTSGKATALVNAGAILCESPGEAAEGVDIVISMLSDDTAVESVTIAEDGILNYLAPGGIHLSMSTIAPDTARRLADLHALRDTTYLGGPVYGRPDVAAAGKLNLLLSGDSEAKVRVRPVQEAMGRAIWDFGDDPVAAHVVKVCGNFMIGAAIAAMGEAYTLAEKNSIDRQAFHEMMSQTVFGCPVYQSYGKLIAAEEYDEVGFSVPLGQKDIRLAQQLGQLTFTPMPLAALVQEKLVATRAKGRDNQDWAALALESSEAAGLDPKRKQK